jgi:hypothetical protein
VLATAGLTKLFSRGMSVIAEGYKESAMSKVVKPSRVRVVAETATASFAGALGVLTIFWHDWY